MERKTFSKAQIYVKESYNRAGRMASTGAFEDAIRVLLPVVKANPEVPMLFEKLREYEIAKCRRQSGLSRAWSQFIGLLTVPVVRLTMLSDPIKAMALCEDPLAGCVDNPPLLAALAAAADACEAPWIASTALNVVRVFHPKNEANLRALATAMQANGQARGALKILNDIAKQHPGDMSIQNEIREAMALASIERGRWEESGATQDKAADAEDAVLQQLLEGTIHDAEQAGVLIRKFTADLQQSDSVDIRRKLAEAYMVAEKYEEALREYRIIAEKIGVADPVLDKQIEKAYLAGLNQALAALEQNPQDYDKPEEQIASIKQEIVDYKRRHVLQRAQMFPNDVQVQYDLGVFYFESGDYENAKKVFLELAKNPQKQRDAWVFLGQCALHADDPAGAIKYLDRAVKAMYRLDRYKREALYYLGIACAQNGDPARAVECFQIIYNNISDYRDVAERITALGATPGVIEESKNDEEEEP